MIFAEESSRPEDRRCLRFKCSSFYELNAMNTLPVHDLSAVNAVFYDLSTVRQLALSVANREHNRLEPTTWSRVSLRNHPQSVITILLAETYSTPGSQLTSFTMSLGVGVVRSHGAR
jgi:hypothetical protein